VPADRRVRVQSAGAPGSRRDRERPPHQGPANEPRERHVGHDGGSGLPGARQVSYTRVLPGGGMKRVLPVLIRTLAVIATTHAAGPAVPTFTKDVAPIMFNNCATCHRTGEVAPMTFLSYEDVRPWAKVIKAKVTAREMPPWGADSEHSLKMRNDRSLSKQQID